MAWGDREQLDPSLLRYSRQVLFDKIGPRGQKSINLARVALVGCGALGTVLANTLIRAGVGFTRIIDRDFIEIDNLQRQVLFDESDISANLPKAEAAARKLHKVNSSVEVEPVVADISSNNIEALCGDVDLLLDGTDNLETRYLINDLAVKLNVPWVYGACVAADGLVMAIVPGKTPCLRCVWDEPPPPGSGETCDTVGVLSSVVNIVASFQAQEALKLLCGRTDDVIRSLMTIDAWSGRVRLVDVGSPRAECRCCGQQKFDFLTGERTAGSTTLCGRNAVQITPAGDAVVDFKSIANRLARWRPVTNEFMLKVAIDEHAITLFRDGRAIVKGTSDPTAARAIYAKYIGS